MSENTNETAVTSVSEKLGIESSISEVVSETAGNNTASSKKQPSKRTKAGAAKDGAIRSAGAEAKPKTNSAKQGKIGKVTTAIYSTKNVYWQGVGKVSKGFNIVSHEEAEQWLTRKHIRIATPEEVAEEYGV